MGKKPTDVLYFGGEHCGPCKTMKPLVEEICRKQDNFLTEYDIEEETAAVRAYGIMSIPAIIRLDTGDRLIGLHGRDRVVEFLK